MEALKLRIPKDVGILGRGNLSVGVALNPQLTSIAIPAFEMGKQAAELLIDVVETSSKVARRIELDAPLIKRQSA